MKKNRVAAQVDTVVQPQNPQWSIGKIITSVALFLVGVNAITAIISVWVGGDLLGKVFLSSINLFFAVIVAYFVIEKFLLHKDVFANTLSLGLLISMFFVTEYVILRPSINSREVAYYFFAGFSSYITYLIALVLNVWVSRIAQSPNVVKLLGNCTMVCAFIAANALALSSIVFRSNEIADKMALTFILLTLFAGMALPIAKLYYKSESRVDEVV